MAEEKSMSDVIEQYLRKNIFCTANTEWHWHV